MAKLHDSSFNSDQQDTLRTCCARISALLEQAEHVLETAETGMAFSKYAPDVSPIERQVIADHAARLRQLMQTFLETHRIALPAPDGSALRAARTLLLEAQVAAEAIEPRFLERCGTLPDEAGKDLGGFVADLLEALDRMSAYLAAGRAEQSLAVPAHPVLNASLLAELKRIIEHYALTGLRAPFEALAERSASRRLEVAVFGRVNSGKSSLVNCILGTDVIPVGVVPVTSVPVRVIHGARPEGRVLFADAPPQIFAPGRLTEFVAQQQNPENQRHATEIVLELPSSVLPHDAVLVDTPGLGSTATGHDAETLAYLPRCDLAIILVDAGAGITVQEVRLADALRRAGAEVTVLLSKCDMLSGDDYWRSAGHVQSELKARAGLDARVYPISIKADGAALCKEWLQRELLPRLRDAQARSEIALSRKLSLLVTDVTAALDRRIERQLRSGSDAAPDGAYVAGNVRERRRAVSSNPLLPDFNPDHAAATIIDEVAHNAAVLWRQSQQRTFDLSPLLLASVHSRARTLAATAVRDVSAMRADLTGELIRRAPHAAPSVDLDLPPPSEPPTLDAAGLFPQADVRAPALSAFATIALYWIARRRLRGLGARKTIAVALAHHMDKLENWRTRRIDDLTNTFEEKTRTVRENRTSTDEPDADSIHADIERLLALYATVTRAPDPKKERQT